MRPLVLHLAFLHLILFLLFLPTLGSLLQGSLQQGVLPLPCPHLLREGTRNGAVSPSSPAAGAFSRRQTQRRSCHRIPQKSQRLSRGLHQAERQESAQRAAPRQGKQSECECCQQRGCCARQREAQVRETERPGLQGTGTFSCSSLLSASASCNCLSSSVLEIGGSGFCQQRKSGEISAGPQSAERLGGRHPHRQHPAAPRR